MKVKKYFVDSITDAMEQIRGEFGDDAYIIDTKEVKTGGFLWFGGKKQIEVTVLSEKPENTINAVKTIERAPANSSADLYNLQTMLERNKRLNEKVQKTKEQTDDVLDLNFQSNKKNESSQYAQQQPQMHNQQLLDLIMQQREISKKLDKDADEYYKNKEIGNPSAKREKLNSNINVNTKSNYVNEANKTTTSKDNDSISELKNMILDLTKKISYDNEYFRNFKEKLLQEDFSEVIIQDIVEKQKLKFEENWMDNKEIKDKMIEYFLNEINIMRDEIKGRIMFVGPTGVGKTTTLAKLAAQLKKSGKKVAIVTIDTYRIAAADQLKIYADIMGLQSYVCYSPGDLKLTAQSLSEYDIVLIDTAGRSHKNDIQLGELKMYIDAIQPEHTILVLSATTRSKDMIEIYEKFSISNPDSVIITKLDETSIYNQIFTFNYHTKLPIRYITTGQKVPDDIMIPDIQALALSSLRRYFNVY